MEGEPSHDASAHQRPRSAVLAAAALATTVLGIQGCAGSGVPVTPPLLAYEEPEPNPAAYTFSDTTRFEIRAPGYGVMEVETGRRGTAELQFGDAANGLRVQVRFTTLDGRVRSGDRSTDAVDADDLAGAIGVDLSPAGRVVVVDTPAVTLTLLEVAGVEGLVRPFFVSLPVRAVEPGVRWTDTVVTREEGPETITRVMSVVVSTLIADTTVEGRRLLRIETRTETASEMTGVSGGVAIEQQLSGTIMGTVLWDTASRLLVARTEAGSLSGSLLMPGTSPVVLPVSATVRRSVELRDATRDR